MGAETYRKASEEIADPELSNMTARMAEDELRHLKWFEQLDTGAKMPASIRKSNPWGAICCRR